MLVFVNDDPTFISQESFLGLKFLHQQCFCPLSSHPSALPSHSSSLRFPPSFRRTYEEHLSLRPKMVASDIQIKDAAWRNWLSLYKLSCDIHELRISVTVDIIPNKYLLPKNIQEEVKMDALQELKLKTDVPCTQCSALLRGHNLCAPCCPSGITSTSQGHLSSYWWSWPLLKLTYSSYSLSSWAKPRKAMNY